MEDNALTRLQVETLEGWEGKALDAEFWEEEIQLLYELLYPLMFKAAMKGAEKALADMLAGGVGVDWGLVNEAVRRWASTYVYDLVRGITETTRRFLQEAIPDWIASGAPLQDLISTLEPMFGAVRAEMIGVTEVTRAFAEGNRETWKESGVVDGLQWMTAEDELVCPICAELGDQGPQSMDSEIPPAHVNCRCWLQPVVEV